MSNNFNHHIQILYVITSNPLAFRDALTRWQSNPPCRFKPGTSGALEHQVWIRATAKANWLAAWLICWLRLDVLRRIRNVWNAAKLLFIQAANLFHYYIWANLTMIPWLWKWRVVYPLSVAWHSRHNNK